MKIQQWVGWIVTGLMAALMLMSAVPDLLRLSGAVDVFRHLGYPPYLLPFLGAAKMLGVAAILVPGMPKLKEWAFAGLLFDVTGALYSHVSVGDSKSGWLPAVVGVALIAGSYVNYRMRLRREVVPLQLDR